MGPDRLADAEDLLLQGRSEDLPGVIEDLRGHLGGLPPGHPDRPRAANLLSYAEVELHNATAETVDDTRRLARVLDALRPDLADNGRGLVTLGGVHDQLWDETQELGEAVAARLAYRDGVERLDADDPLRHSSAERIVYLGTQLSDIARDPGDRVALADDNVRYARLALATVAAEDGDVGRAQWRYNLANTLRLRGLWTRRADDTAEALDLLAQARRHAPDDLAALIPNAEALCHKDLDQLHHRPGALDAEIDALDRAWALRDAAPAESRDVIFPRNLANALAERCRRGGAAAGDAERALALYRSSAEQAAAQVPRQVEMTVSNWLVFATEQRAWDDVIAAGELGLTVIRVLERSQPDMEGKGSVAFPKRSIVAFLVNAHLERSGDVLAAAAAAERGRSWLLADAEAADARAALIAAAELTPLCHLIELEDRLVALCVPGGGAAPFALDLELDEEEVIAVGGEFLSAMTRFPQEVATADFTDIVERTGRWLWDVVMGRLAAAHRERGALAIIAWGRFALLPLQAAWTEDDDAESGRRYVIDELCLSFPVSATRALEAHRSAAAVRSPSALVVAWPGTREAALAWVPVECQAALQAFPEAQRRHVAAATRADVHAHVGRHDVVHFACHADANLEAPFASALELADGALDVYDLLDARLDARLVFLSACETGVIGADMPEEAISLGGVLAQVGAAGVIASSWPVPDAATAALAVHFYEAWREDGLPPAEALRTAQVRVRDCVGRVGALSSRVLGTFPDLDDPPLPAFYWAAFAFSGR